MLNQLTTKSVKTTIARAIGLIVIFTLIAAVSSFSILLLSLHDASAINFAGKLQTQSYLLALDVQNGSSMLQNDINEFEHILYNKLNEPINRWYVPYQVKQHYLDITEQWQQLKKFTESDSNLVRQKVLQFSPAFVRQIGLFVDELQKYAEYKMRFFVFISGIGLIVIFLIGLLVIQFTQKQIVIPLGKLIKASHAIKNQHFDIQLWSDVDNEIGTLINQFSEMAVQLHTLYHNLEQNVAEKNRRLKQSNRALKTLYQCSQIFSVVTIKRQQFQQALDTLLRTESVQALQLIIREPKGSSWQIESGIPDKTLAWSSTSLVIENEVFGQLKWQNPTTTINIMLIQNTAYLIAQALHQNKTQKKAQQLLLLDERATIARELHDSLAQSLSYLKIQMSLLKRFNHTNPEKEDAIIAEIDKGLSEAYKQLRELLATFRLTLTSANFGEALTEMVHSLQNRTETKIIIDNQLSSLEISAPKQVHLLQLIREACLNAVKHAQADRILIKCLQQNGLNSFEKIIYVTIEDNGIGFEPSITKINHYGLTIMNERAQSLNADLSIDSQLNQGCTVHLTFTLSQRDEIYEPE